MPKFAPFDKIIVTCGASEIPIELINQLKIGGKLVAPIGNGEIQEMQLLEKVTEKGEKVTTHGKFSFVPMLSNKN